jgi:Uma2 family endonuclease
MATKILHKEKVMDWLRAGTRMVWVVDPRTRTVAVHEPSGTTSILTETQVLTGGEVLPGFACPVSDLFA